MSEPQQVRLDRALLDYVLAHSAPLPPTLEQAVERAAGMDRSSMQVAPDQALLIRMLLRIIGARRVLEIGTFLGYSATVMAEAVGPEGRIVCLDVNGEWTARARELWKEAGVADRIELRLGDAHDLVRAMAPGETFEAVLIDADKTGYLDYLEQVTPRLRHRGLLLVDNTLWYGRVTDPDDLSESTTALRRFNEALASDGRYDVAVVPVGDGLTVARRL